MAKGKKRTNKQSKQGQSSGSGKSSGSGQGGKQVALGGGGTRATLNKQTPQSNTVSLRTSFSIQNSGNSGDITVTGSEIVGLVQMGTVSNGIVFIANLNPFSWNGCRVQQMARLYERYRVQQVTITYVPTCGSNTTGLVYMYYDRDVLDAPVPGVDSAASISRLMSNQGAVVGQVWNPVRMNYAATGSDQNSYFINPTSDADLRSTNQAIVYAYSNAAIGSITGGLFKFDYNIRFYTPTGPIMAGTNPSGSGGWQWAEAQINGTADGTNLSFSSATLGPKYDTAIYQVLFDKGFTANWEGFSNSLVKYTPFFLRCANGVLTAYSTLAGAQNSEVNTIIRALSTVTTAGNIWYQYITADYQQTIVGAS